MDENKKSALEKNALSRTVLSDQIRDIIADSILSGELEPGDRVAENNMARKLGVSQAPVRDAIRDLVFMGFLKSEPYKGATVRSFTQEDLNEVYLVRASLESLAARLAAPLITDEDIQNLEKILKDMVNAAKKGDAKGSSGLNTQFHETILEISGNRLLHKLWKTLQFGYWAIATARRPEFELEYLAERHGDLIEALKSRDSEKAQQAMQKHIEDLGKPVQGEG
jgi:DNA-binding GntR family transcriptional regulator